MSESGSEKKFSNTLGKTIESIEDQKPCQSTTPNELNDDNFAHIRASLVSQLNNVTHMQFKNGKH